MSFKRIGQDNYVKDETTYQDTINEDKDKVIELLKDYRLNELKRTIQENKNMNKNSGIHNFQTGPYQKPRDLRIPTVDQLQERLKKLKKIKN